MKIPTHTSRNTDWRVSVLVRTNKGSERFTCTAYAPDMQTAEVFVRAKIATEGWKALRVNIAPPPCSALFPI